MSAGIKANNDGSAAIQVGGTDYITISSTGAVAIPVSLTVGGVPAGGNYNLVAYTSPASGPTGWDATAKKAAGLKAIKVTVVGAGGNGGPTTANPGTAIGGGGGGGGGAAVAYVPASSITPGTKTVTAGAGTNSFGPWGTATPFSPTATASATAGSNAAANATNNQGVAGGAAGTGSGGSINITGTPGFSSPGGGDIGGEGGGSIMGGGAVAASALVATAVNGNPAPATSYGGGGSGSVRNGPTGGTTGGTGAPGIVIIEEFY